MPEQVTSNRAIRLVQLHLKQFRCFSHIELQFDASRVLIQGANGSGKTSLLEALHYLCYLRSFRTHIPQDLVHAGAPSFFIKARFNDAHAQIPLVHEAQVGFSHRRRLVKIDDHAVSSYKELLSHYRVLTLTEDDILLVTGGPDIRRTFIDQALLLYDSSFVIPIRKLRSCLEQRNALLQDPRHTLDAYLIWTEQLWNISIQIQEQRRALLNRLEQEISSLGAKKEGDSTTRIFPEIVCRYVPKLIPEGITHLQDFMKIHPDLPAKEKLWGRTLFGAHLDDIMLSFQDKKSKTFASRGQQKLIVLLLKTALARLLNQHGGPKPIFLLDDFMTDFDDSRIAQLVDLLYILENQLIFTCPSRVSTLSEHLVHKEAQHILLPPRAHCFK
jgi:DNA replication and repair protein RecF